MGFKIAKIRGMFYVYCYGSMNWWCAAVTRLQALSSHSWIYTQHSYTPITLNESVTFWLQPPGHCLVRVLLHCMRVRLRNGYTRVYAQIMQHTHMHNAVTRRVEAKKLLSRRK